MFNFKLNPLQGVVYTKRRFVKKLSMLFYPRRMDMQLGNMVTGFKIG